MVSETACANCGFLPGRATRTSPRRSAPGIAGWVRCAWRADWAEFEPAEQAAFNLLANAAAGAIVNARLAEDRRRQAEQAAVLGERERLAEELHDGKAQTLGFLNMKCDRLQEMITAGATGARSGVGADARRRSRAYGQVRCADGIAAPLPEADSFASQLASCIEEMAAATALPIKLVVVDGGSLSPACARRNNERCTSFVRRCSTSGGMQPPRSPRVRNGRRCNHLHCER